AGGRPGAAIGYFDLEARLLAGPADLGAGDGHGDPRPRDPGSCIHSSGESYRGPASRFTFVGRLDADHEVLFGTGLEGTEQPHQPVAVQFTRRIASQVSGSGRQFV